jgi:predicted transcriptional regulator
MEKIKKLPDAEFEVMKVAWANEPPITANTVIGQLGSEKDWKAQTVNSLMLRLVKRGFLRTEKNGKERSYFPLVGKSDYLRFETESFMKTYHGNSFVSLVNTLSDGKQLSEADIAEVIEWARKR